MTAPAGRLGGRTAVLPSMRRLLVLAAVLVLLARYDALPLPVADRGVLRVDDRLPHDSGLPRRGVLVRILLELGGAQARSWVEGRVAVPTVFVFTTLTLIATLLHLSAFHFGSGHPLPGRVIASAWLAIYVAVPVLMVVISIVQHRSTVPGPPRARPLSPAVRWALVVLLVVLAVVGVGLFVAPNATAGWWPWDLTPLTARAVGAWLIGLAVGGGHALLEDDVARVKPLGPTAVAFVVLQGVALARHGGELDWSSASAWVYIAGLAALLAVGGWIVMARTGPATG